MWPDLLTPEIIFFLNAFINMLNILSYLDQRVPSVVEMSSDDVTESLRRRPELAEDGAA